MEHNFAASAAYRLEDVNSGKTNGLITASVMDYNPANIAPPGSPQGPYFQTKVGPYDDWFIEYTYKPLSGKTKEERARELQTIADRANGSTELSLATDRDLDASPKKRDPGAARFDLGSDPLGYQIQKVEMAQGVFNALSESNSPARDYRALSWDFVIGLDAYFKGVESAARYIGGVRYSRDHMGSPGRLPQEPVSFQEQRRALQFVTQRVFRPDALEFKPDLIKKLVPEDLPGTMDSIKRINVGDRVSSLDKAALEAVLGEGTLDRVRDNALMTRRGEQVVTAQELFDTTRKSIWIELDRRGKVTISDQRQALQQMHIEKLAGLLGASAGDSALARSSLKEISGKVRAVLVARTIDSSTRAHLEDVQARIKQALSPKTSLQLRIEN